MTTRNAFADLIEAPDGNTKLLAKDGINAAGYVTIEGVSELALTTPVTATGGTEARTLADWFSMLEGTSRIRMAGYVPEYNMTGTQVEDSGTELSANITIDMGDFTLPAGNKQHAFMTWLGTVRSTSAAEQEGLKVLRFEINSEDADAYFIQGQVTLSGTGAGKPGGKDVKGIYARARLAENAVGAPFGLVGSITIPNSSTPNPNSASLQLTVDGDKANTGTAIFFGTAESTRVVRRGFFSGANVGYSEAVVEATAAVGSSTGDFIRWMSTTGNYRFRVLASGATHILMTQTVAGTNLEVLNSAAVVRATANADGGNFNFYKTRNTNPGGAFTRITSGDELVRMLAYGDDGDQFLNRAHFKCFTYGTIADNLIPTYWAFGASSGGAIADVVGIGTKGIKIGTSPWNTDRATTEGTNQLVLFNGTAPVGTLANGVTLYSAAGVGRVMDAAGVSTLISPHNEAGDWVFDSTDTVKGRRLLIEVERMLRFLNDKYGTDFVHDLEA